MAFEPGHEKVGGRQKGTPNKRTQSLIDLAEELDEDPARFLLLVMKGDLRVFGYEDRVKIHRRSYDLKKEKHEEKRKQFLLAGKKDPGEFPEYIAPTEEEAHEMNLLDIEMRKEAAVDLMPYRYPKRKSVEVEVKDNRKTINMNYQRPGTKPDVEV